MIWAVPLLAVLVIVLWREERVYRRRQRAIRTDFERNPFAGPPSTPNGQERAASSALGYTGPRRRLIAVIPVAEISTFNGDARPRFPSEGRASGHSDGADSTP